MIELANITKVFDGASGSNRALDDVTLTIESGEIFGIIGESGAGKSTLVNALVGAKASNLAWVDVWTPADV